MNVVGHMLVAARLSDDPALHVGAALSDLAGFGQYRLEQRSTIPAIAAGVALHHRTDDAFHTHPWFTERQRRLGERLEAEGVGRGPRRAAAHVGPEMLIDGALLQSPRALATVRAALDQLVVADNRLADLVHADGWERHLRLVAERGIPSDYDDPDAVANRLARILERRPRLRFADGDVTLVAKALRDEWASIAETATWLVDDLARMLDAS